MNYPHGPAFQQAGRKSSNSSRDPSIIGLVEQYLADNSTSSYINIDDMVDSLQDKSFRFARMKRPVFYNLVRKSYFDYCQRNQGDTLVPAEVFTENSSSPSQTKFTPIASDSDSDVEIQEQYQPRNDLVNSHLTSLYSASKNGKKSQGNAAANTKQNTNAGKTSIVKTALKDVPSKSGSSSSNLLLNSSIENNTENSEILGVNKSLAHNADDSDNDLEIIEEVKGDGVIRQANNGSIAKSNGDIQSPEPNGMNTSSLLDNTSSQEKVDTIPRVVKSSVEDIKRMTSILSKNDIFVTTVKSKESKPECPPPPTFDKNKPKDVEIDTRLPSRGSKRKAPSSVDGGINEDLTPKKRKKEINVVQDSGYRLSDFAGSEKVVEEVCRLLMHLKHPEVYKTLGVTAPRGFLLHGPPGTGKTLLANALAGELQLPMLKVTGTEFISGISGESESNIRDLFNQAVAIAPCIIFIDEIDSITPKRENAQREMERRVVAQLLSCVDDLMNHERGSQVLLIGATNRIEAIDSALRRAGRFDREICLGIPDEKSRAKILSVICRNLRLAPGFDLNMLAKYTPGYVGADLSALVREAAVQAVNKALLASDQMRVKSTEHYLHSEAQSDSDLIICEDEEEDPYSTQDTITGLDKSETSKQTSDVIGKIDTSNSQTADLLENVQSSTSSTDDRLKKVESSNAEIQAIIVVEKDSTSSDLQQTVITTQEVSIDELNPAETVSELEKHGNDSNVCKNLISSEENMDTDSITDVGIKIIPVVVDRKNSNDTVEQLKAQSSDVVMTEGEDAIHRENLKIESNELNEEEPSHLRWIREIAPLSKNELDELYIFMDDFEIALKYVQPSSKREGFATVPDTTWDDIGALKDIREELEVSILGPVKHSSAFQMLGLNTPAGVLLCGPPGCGKTLLAKAVANEAGINFISVKGPELLNMYVGESERAVRQCFLRAKNSSPCVIFFDELDALCPRRSDNPESGSGSRIVNQLLTEMDGMESRAGVFVMAATNRPDIIDPAILRPGRLDKILFVDLPSAADRLDILKAITKEGTRPILDIDVNMKEISEREACDNYTGADLAALVREASIAAFRDLVLNPSGNSFCLDKDLKVSARHFDTAFLKTKPSVTKTDRQKYAEMKERYSSLR